MARSNRHLLIVLALVLAGLLAPAGAWAQPGSDSIEHELDRTDALLERAIEVVREAISDRPRSVLATARELQASAREAFAHDKYQIAVRRTRLAREAAGRAVDLATAELRLLDQVRALIAGNDDVSARAREIVAASGNPEAARLLEAGLVQLRRGQRAFHDREFRAAVRLSLFGRDLLLRAIRAAEGGDRLDEARVRDELARTDEFLRQANVESSERSKRRYEEARRLQHRAERELGRRQLARARRLTLRARELVLDALREETSEPGVENVQALVERVEARHARLAERAPRGETEVRLLREARAHLGQAARALDDGELRRALAEAQLANSLLDQIESR